MSEFDLQNREDKFLLDISAIADPKIRAIILVLELIMFCGGKPIGGCLRELLRLSFYPPYTYNPDIYIHDIDAQFSKASSFEKFQLQVLNRGWEIEKRAKSVQGMIKINGIEIKVDFCIGDFRIIFPASNGRVDFDVCNLYLSQLIRDSHNVNLFMFTFCFRDQQTVIEKGLTLQGIRQAIWNKQFTIVMSPELISESANLSCISQRVIKMTQRRGWI
jgi:hypothetical protein